jgi:ribose transport system substrate-binding protein
MSLRAGAWRGRWRLATALLCLVAVFAIAACSDDDNSSSDSSGGGATASGDASKAGSEASGESLTLPSGLTAGILHVQGNAQSDQLIGYALTDALDELGVKYTEKDPQGNPGKTATDLDALIGQDPDVIFGISVEAAGIQSQLRKMKDRGIPFINVGGTIRESPLVALSPVPSDYAQAAIASQYLLDLLASENNGTPAGKVASFGFDPIYSLLQRRQTFELMAEPYKDVDIVAQHQVDFEDPNADIQGATQDIVQANPDLKAIYTCCDFTLPPIAAGLRQANAADKVKVVSVQLGTPAALDLVKNGSVTAVGNAALGASSYMAVDEWARAVAQDREMCRDCWHQYEQMFAYDMVGEDNLDISYELRPDFVVQKLVVDYPAFFSSKWKQEFGL